MTNLQFIISGYLPYFSFKKWKWGWLSPYGCVIIPTILADVECYIICYTVKGKNNIMTIPTFKIKNISALQMQEEMLIKCSTYNKLK